MRGNIKNWVNHGLMRAYLYPSCSNRQASITLTLLLSNYTRYNSISHKETGGNFLCDLVSCYRTPLRWMVLFLMLLKRINCQYSVMICLSVTKTMRKSTIHLGRLLLYFRCPVAWPLYNTRLHTVYCAVVLVFLLITTCDSRANAVCWQKLVYRDSRLMSCLVTEIERVSSVAILPGHFKAFQSIVMDSPLLHRQDLQAVYVKTTVTGLWVSDLQYERLIWFDPKNLAAVGRLRWSSNRPQVVKYYLWEQEGVRRLKYLRQGDSVRLSKTSVYCFSNESGPRHSIISEPTLILYLVSSHELMGSEAMKTFCVFGKKQLHRITISRSTIPNRGEDTSQMGDQCRVVLADGAGVCPTADTLFQIRTDSDYDTGRERFSLLGLEDHISISVDSASGIPVEISGWNRKVGKVELRLKRAFLSHR